MVQMVFQSNRSDLAAFDRWVDEQPAGSARALFTDDIHAALAALIERVRSRGALIAVPMSEGLLLGEIRVRLVEALAEGALARWPFWYGRTFTATGSHDDLLARPAEIAAVVATEAGVLSRWLEDASSRARAGGRPLVADVHIGVQARQLALALDREELRVAVAAPWEDGAQLDGVARATEWLAAETGARVIAVLLESVADHPAIDRISYQGGVLRVATSDPSGAPAEPVALVVQPVLGRPHPLSRVEQQLARVLAAAADLRPLFEFNQRIETARGAHAIVDLVWRQGRVIVELDGWDTHGNRYAFASDRQRDYELMISGYLVLRLTNEEILDDTAKAIDKIRDLIRFREAQREKA